MWFSRFNFHVTWSLYAYVYVLFQVLLFDCSFFVFIIIIIISRSRILVFYFLSATHTHTPHAYFTLSLSRCRAALMCGATGCSIRSFLSLFNVMSIIFRYVFFTTSRLTGKKCSTHKITMKHHKCLMCFHINLLRLLFFVLFYSSFAYMACLYMEFLCCFYRVLFLDDGLSKNVSVCNWMKYVEMPLLWLVVHQ